MAVILGRHGVSCFIFRHLTSWAPYIFKLKLTLTLILSLTATVTLFIEALQLSGTWLYREKRGAEVPQWMVCLPQLSVM